MFPNNNTGSGRMRVDETQTRTRRYRKTLRGTIAALVMSVLGGGFALASHVAQLDPETVPEGVFVSHNHFRWVGIKALERTVKPNGADIQVQHVALDPGEALPWHSHPGPAFLTVASGSVTVEEVRNGTCFRRVVEAGNGFFEKGAQVMRVVAGDDGAHNYVTFVLPPGSATHITTHDAPEECAS
jgi:hypothetical protein